MKTHTRLSCVAIVFVAAASVAARGQALDESIEEGRALARHLRETVELPGLSITVAVDGEVAWSEGFGTSNLEAGTPATPQTRYRIGSVSKLITAATLARLVQEGRMDLDAPVEQYVPSFSVEGVEITARRLAGHLGGIRHYQSADDFLNREHYATVSEALGRFRDDALRHAPGEQYAYSSFGYVLLSAMMEGATGEDFLDLVRELVLDPLVMDSTVPDEASVIVPHRSGRYSRSDGQLHNGAYIDLSDRWAAGGFLSTSEDMARFGVAHLRNRFISSETRTLLFTSQRTISGEETGVGLGWRIAEDARGRRYYHHAGSNIGARSILVVYPDSDIVVCMLANLSRAPFGRPEAVTIAELFMMAPEGLEPWDPAGTYDYERTAEDRTVRGELELTRAGRQLSGRISAEGEEAMPIVWSSVRGSRLTLAAADPRGQLEIVWLRREGRDLAGSTWRRTGDFLARRRAR